MYFLMFHQRFLMFHQRFSTSHISKKSLYLDVLHGLRHFSSVKMVWIFIFYGFCIKNHSTKVFDACKVFRCVCFDVSA